jgi:perosamine synthetase
MRRGRRYWHELAGFNYRMTNLQAAVGVAQMERVDRFIERRKEIGERYIDRLGGLPGLVMPPGENWGETIYWIFSMRIEPEVAGLSRDQLTAELESRRIETRPFFIPLHLQPPYKQSGEFPVSTEISTTGISLPSGNDISDTEIDRVCDTIGAILKNRKHK